MGALALHFRDPVTNALLGSCYDVLDGPRIVFEQLDAFDAHEIPLADIETATIVAMQPKTVVEIEDQGLGIIAKGVILSPSHQIAHDGVGRIVLHLPNITEQARWIRTGYGYRDAQEAAQLIANLGSLTTYDESLFDYTKVNKYGMPGYDDYGRAITILKPGKATGWSATFVDLPGVYHYSSAPVQWILPVSATVNGNTLTRDPAHPVGEWDAGAHGIPDHWDTTHDVVFSWQVVDPQQQQYTGLTNPVSFGQFSVDFGFYIDNGTWKILENGGAPSGTGTARRLARSPIRRATRRDRGSRARSSSLLA